MMMFLVLATVSGILYFDIELEYRNNVREEGIQNRFTSIFELVPL